ncbi:hypothetical protein [Bdellovibrio reynosensis]|uniref:Uncharacterized protein n=1 Tax=Bdellovibrio reynosensis TaxID=2835041 RepID=A0ABY4CBN9_9BACT|nr:hypothetical protein [Bdellovibrio reynosensis]UOF02325.1 hypothetical protein MNR06_05090 [Bdellovibrio reynosensis]
MVTAKKKPAHLDQNLMGFYLSLSGWLVGLMLSMFHFVFGADLWKQIVLFIICFIGIGASYLFYKRRNFPAVLLQTITMFASVGFSVIFPTAGPMVNLVFIYIAVFPVAMLEVSNATFMFINFAACVLAVLTSELATHNYHSNVNEQIFTALLKFSILSLVFFVVFMMRSVLEHRNNEIYDKFQDEEAGE